MNKRLMAALACYALFCVLAWLTLDGELRWIIWILMAALAVKSWVAAKQQD